MTKYRILPVTIQIADIAAELQLRRTYPAIDVLIAATAIAHDLTLASRNTSDFAGTGVKLVNPWLYLADG